jgi:hypothetical protein
VTLAETFTDKAKSGYKGVSFAVSNRAIFAV